MGNKFTPIQVDDPLTVFLKVPSQLLRSANAAGQLSSAAAERHSP